ncbi:spore germination protein KC [Seinonella peptonophila]|uniref:Spore germination protein KC n=1 Tax=Seinonella peptonophila TaxID=112248 RepID=A0A1M4Y561_9BACL|nr:Ger(x)C family spore germination protein [Seinonella peptonophila]SHF00582.1 spore germination protein KC [Seinonella peptonophila]
MKVTLKSWLLLALISCICFICTGCWSSIEVNDRTFITGVYVDKGNKPGEVELTLTAPLPNRLVPGSLQGGGTGERSYAALSKTGKTIPFAIQRIQSDLTRKLSWGHTRVIVISRDYAQSGITPLLEWITRQPTFHIKTYILISPGKAKETVKLTPVFERAPSEVLREFANQKTILGATVRDFLLAHYADQGTAVSFLTMGTMPMVSEQGKKSEWAGTDGAAIFRDDQMVGKIAPEKARMLSWVIKQIKSPTFVFQSPVDHGKISVEFERIDANILPKLRGKQIVYNIELLGDASIVSADTKESITKPHQWHQLENILKKKLAKNLKKALVETQRLRADVLRLGNRLEWWYPNRWKQVKDNWPDVYQKQVFFEIEPKIYIKHSGLEGDSLWKFK